MNITFLTVPMLTKRTLHPVAGGWVNMTSSGFRRLLTYSKYSHFRGLLNQNCAFQNVIIRQCSAASQAGKQSSARYTGAIEKLVIIIKVTE